MPKTTRDRCITPSFSPSTYHRGKLMDGEVGELTQRGCYLGSNVSYNLKKMVENSYVEQARSPHDRRSVHVRLTAKGRGLRDRLAEMHARHAERLSQNAITVSD